MCEHEIEEVLNQIVETLIGKFEESVVTDSDEDTDDKVLVAKTETMGESATDAMLVDEALTAEEKADSIVESVESVESVEGVEGVESAAAEVEIVTQLSPPYVSIDKENLTEAELHLLYESKKIEMKKEALIRAQQRNASWLMEKKSAEQIIDECLKPYTEMYEQAQAVRLHLEALSEELRGKRCRCLVQDDFAFSAVTEEPSSNVDSDQLQLDDLKDEGAVVKTKKFKKH